MMTTDNFSIRPMNRSEVDLAIAWAAAEGWNPGRYDAESFYQADPHGFFLAELNGEPVGCISAIAYEQHFGVLGFYIVQPQFRGRGFGLKLWKAAMAYLGTDRYLSLNGVAAQQDNYKKSGFQIAYQNIRYQGLGGGVAPSSIVELKTLPFGKLVEYDRQLFPAKRSQFLQHWINQPESAALGMLKDEQLVGYGVIRPSYTGYRIGPLFADNEQIAEELFQALIAKHPDAAIFLDIPDANPQAIALAERHKMQPIVQLAQMYTKTIPQFPLNQVFAITSVEIG